MILLLFGTSGKKRNIRKPLLLKRITESQNVRGWKGPLWVI